MKIEDILSRLSKLINWSDLNNPLMYELADGKELYFKDKFYCSLYKIIFYFKTRIQKRERNIFSQS